MQGFVLLFTNVLKEKRRNLRIAYWVFVLIGERGKLGSIYFIQYDKLGVQQVIKKQTDPLVYFGFLV